MQYLSFPINAPVAYVSCGNLVCEERWIHSERVIDTFELIIGIEGEVYIQQDDFQYTVKPGNMMIVLPGHIHKGYRESSGAISFYWVHFKLKNPRFWDSAAAENIIEIISNNPYSQFSQQALFPIYGSVEFDSQLEILFHQLFHIRRAPCYTALAADYILTNILIQLADNLLSSYTLKQDKPASNRSFEAIIEWIRLNYNKPISAAQISGQFYYNPNYFSKLFKQKTGAHLTNYINAMRISSAKAMLYQTNLTIKEIAYAVGYEDDKYFMRIFKKLEGITPTHYRNAFYRTHLNNE